VVLTQSAAKAFFGDGDPINKVLKIDNDRSVEVSAVIADPPGNSLFSLITSGRLTILIRGSGAYESMARICMECISSIRPGADINLLNKHINDVERLHNPEDKVSTYFTFPMSKWRLYSEFKDGKNIGGMIEYVRLFTIIALIILLIACVNL
jgi:hypothetical protein